MTSLHLWFDPENFIDPRKVFWSLFRAKGDILGGKNVSFSTKSSFFMTFLCLKNCTYFDIILGMNNIKPVLLVIQSLHVDSSYFMTIMFKFQHQEK